VVAVVCIARGEVSSDLLICARLLISVRTNLIVRVSCIHGYEIYVVSYACLDSDYQLYKADYVVYILMRPPPD
jgi:hypothetical protein